MNTSAAAKPDITVRYSAIQGLFWLNYCILGGFANVYLLEHHFSNSMIGAIVAVSGILSACCSPLVAAYADRPESLSVRKILTLMSAGMAALMVMISATGRNYILTIISYTAGMTLIQLMASLTSSLATQSMRSGYRVNFGTARGIGSLMYGLSAHALGFLVAKTHPDILPAAAAVSWAVNFLLYLRFPDTKDVAVMYAGENAVPAAKRSGSPIAFFRKYPRYGFFLLGLFFVYISHSLANVFVTQVVISKGGTNADTGLILGVQALVEIPVMFGFSRMLKVIKANNWMRICVIVYVLKSIGTYASASVGQHVAVQVLEMGSYAVMVVCGLYYVNSIMRTEDCVKGQSYMGISTTVANVAASWIGGRMLDLTDVPTMLIFGMISAAFGAVIVLFCAQAPKDAYPC